jgi:site-specific recombinase XerD
MLLLLLYSTGLRISEALHLHIGDVDIDAAVLHVRDTKFFKSRLVPMSHGLREQLQLYMETRRSMGSVDGGAFLFINCRRRPYSYKRARDLFCLSLQRAGVPHRATRVHPRLHHVRHTFAVHRVLKWYQDGADIQAKLPLLSTYLGHGNVLSTHVYLTATAEVLAEATKRFERGFISMISPSQEAQDE